MTAQVITSEAVGRDKEPSPAWETAPTGQGELEKGNAWSEGLRNVVKTPCLEARGRVFQGEGWYMCSKSTEKEHWIVSECL